MNASQKTKAAYFNYIGSIELTEEVINLCHHSGPCDEDVIRCMELPEVKAELAEIDPEALRKELYEYGAWDDEELKNHNDNLMRILWLAAGNIQDGRWEELKAVKQKVKRKKAPRYCKYQVNFLDGTHRIEVMTDAQRCHVGTRKEWPLIKNILGLGYCDKEGNAI